MTASIGGVLARVSEVCEKQMSLLNRKNLIFLLVFLTCLCGLFFLKSVGAKTNSRLLLAELSKQERSDLRDLCEFCIKNTEFGYTLFGTKPVCLFTFSCECDETFLNKNRLLFERVRPILKKLAPQVEMHKYIFSTGEGTDFGDIYFFNKELVAETMLENRLFFEQQTLLEKNQKEFFDCITSENFAESIFKDNDALLGIFLGFGKGNALNFARMVQLRRYFRSQGIPPWKCSETFLSEEQKEFLGIESSYSYEGPFLPAPPPPVINLSQGFGSLEEEVEHLMSVLQPSTKWIPDDIASVQLPQFLCDSCNPETITLLKNYKEQQEQLKKILSADNLLELVFEKLTEE
jgi:hypothetical protein